MISQNSPLTILPYRPQNTRIKRRKVSWSISVVVKVVTAVSPKKITRKKRNRQWGLARAKLVPPNVTACPLFPAVLPRGTSTESTTPRVRRERSRDIDRKEARGHSILCTGQRFFVHKKERETLIS